MLCKPKTAKDGEAIRHPFLIRSFFLLQTQGLFCIMEASAAHTGRAPKKTFMQKAFEAYQASYEALLPKLNADIEKVHSMGAEVLLSCHPGIPMTSEQVVKLALFLEKTKSRYYQDRYKSRPGR